MSIQYEVISADDLLHIFVHEDNTLDIEQYNVEGGLIDCMVIPPELTNVLLTLIKSNNSVNN